MAIGWRRFDTGTGAIDDETFDKLTIWMAVRPSAPTTIDLSVSTDGVRVFYSEGASAWLTAGCNGLVADGTLTLTPVGDGFAVAIDATTTPAGNGNVLAHCDAPDVVRLEFTAPVLAFSALTPWLGRAADHSYAETYR